MRRLCGSLLLAFCLVSSQQAALLHELSHFAQRSGTLQSAEAGTQPPGMRCDICLAFAHIAGAVAAAVVVLALLPTAEHWVLTERFALRAADAPHARARDPPAAF
ncbi:MAG: hypothetical protein JO370_05025 [Paucibacter sp.]|nr:hypothetical protein [Roseateles sp.]